jgi:hypothetical protein
MLLFALIALGLALAFGIRQQAWVEALLWLALAIFCACYGAIALGAPAWLQRPLLIAGLASGGIAFWLALQSSLGW